VKSQFSENIMGFFSSDDPPPPPDMSGVINAAKELNQIALQAGQDQLKWAQDQFTANKGQIDKFVTQLTDDANTARGYQQNFQDIANKQFGVAEGASNIREAAMTQADRANAIGDTQLGVQQKQLGVQDQQLENQKAQLGLQQDFRQDQAGIQQKADQLYQQYSQTYAPAQARFMADAEAYGTPEKIAQARAGAAANVGDQFQAARDAATRQLESFGIKPSDTRFAALDLGTRIKEAATKAAAGDAAALTAEDRAFALRQAAIAQGKDLPSQSTAMTGQANAAGSNVVGQGNVANAAGNVAAGFGSLANTAGSNAVGATNAATGAINAATGATNAETGALSGATTATQGGLGANVAGATETGKAGDLLNQTYTTGAQAMGRPTDYLNTALGGVTAGTGAAGTDYQNKLGEFKAEQSASSGIGSVLGAAAGLGMTAMGLPGGSVGGAAISKLFSAEGGAIPMSTSPTQGQAVDDVPAQLTAGEFVIPREVTSWYGEKFFQNLIQKAQNEKGKAQAKPAVGGAPSGPPAVVSRPGPGAIPMGA
jgi:hypothetical protein